MRFIHVRTIPFASEQWTAAVGRQMRAIAASFCHPIKPRRAERAALNGSHPEFYGVPARHNSASAVKVRLNELDVAAKDVEAAQAYLPIGPSCC